MGHLGRATCTVHLIFAPDQTSQEGNECTTKKEKLRAYCPNIYTVDLGQKLPLKNSVGLMVLNVIF